MENIQNDYTGFEVAVIGMSGRFPGAGNIDELWENIKSGTESISFFADEELQAEGVDENLYKSPNYIKAKGILDDIEYFDPEFFDFNSNEANLIDPQIRVFHECVWSALENSGYVPDKYNGLIGLYAGITANMGWNVSKLLQNESGVDQFAIGNLNSNFFSTLISYKLNLKGPSVCIQTACSTSLVAIHNACRALLTGETDIALAGGVTISLPNKQGYLYQEGMVMSPDGHLRAFDKDAKGIVNGNGTGVVVLKRLNDAIKDNDNIQAVIRSSAINNDGNRKVGYTAPSTEGQAEVIKTTHQLAEIESESISYIEAHGTGTSFGDPVEIEALKKAFKTNKKQYCAIGTLKSNIGHLDSAAGVAGFIKTVLSLKNRMLPPSINFKSENPKINFKDSPFYVNTTLKEWKNDKFPLRAGVSSFGIGGTNAHILLEEAPVAQKTSKSRDSQMIFLSAKSKESLENNRNKLVSFLKDNPETNIGDLAYTLQTGRADFKYRAVLVAKSVDEISENLSSDDNGKVIKHFYNNKKSRTIFMFPGQGSQYINMGRDLYNSELIFKNELDNCFEILDSLVEYSIKDILYPNSEVQNKEIIDIDKTPILNFIIEYALGKLIIHWCKEPYAMTGHSIGEYVCACLSGVISLKDSLKIIVLRGKLMSKLPGGVMLSVPLEWDALQKYMTDEISLAADHGYSCLVSGNEESISSLEKLLKNERLICQRLSITHAGHSQQMKDMEDLFIEGLSDVKFNEPSIPYISNITGDWINIEEATSKKYWAQHVSKTVQFAKGIKTILENDNTILLEIGPGNVLSTIALQLKSKESNQFILNTLKYPNQKISDQQYLLNRLARYWMYGGKISWGNYYAEEKRKRIVLPSYSFKRNKFSTQVIKVSDLGKVNGAEKEQSKTSIDNWFYVPSLKNTIISRFNKEEFIQKNNKSLLFINNDSISEEIIEKFKELNQDYTLVSSVTNYKNNDSNQYIINPNNEEDYYKLFSELKKLENLPNSIIYLWPIKTNLKNIEENILYSFKGICAIAKGFFRNETKNKLEINIITNEISKIENYENCISSVVQGPLLTIPLEYPNIRCKNIDISISGNEDNVLNILNECINNSYNNQVIFNKNQRLLKSYEPVTITEKEKNNIQLKQNGTYLITGGTGGIGISMASFLAENYGANLVLLEKSEFPAETEWDNWISSNKSNDKISATIKKLKLIKQNANKLIIASSDVSNYQSVANVIENTEKQMGQINGVFHCAGYTKSGIIQNKPWDTIESTLNPKIKGTLNLDKIFKDRPLDFMVLFSSLNSIIPAMGLVDYVSANAFLDAFAQKKSIEKGTNVISINWEAWKRTGGAYNATKELMNELDDSEKVPLAHPLLSYTTKLKNNTDIFVSELSPVNNWVLNEHRIDNKATMPGTGFLEIIYAAAKHCIKTSSCHLENVFLIKPFSINNSESKSLYTLLKDKNEDAKEVYILSKSEQAKEWTVHLYGTVKKLQKESPNILDYQDFNSNINGKEIVDFTSVKETKNELIAFGKRWLNNFIKLKINGSQKFIHLKLPQNFEEDVNEYQLHPGLLDTALAVNHSNDLFLPFFYKSVKINSSLPSEIYSCITQNNSVNKDAKPFNIIISDTAGEKIVEIQDYTVVAVKNSTTGDATNDVSFLDLTTLRNEINALDKIEAKNKNADEYIEFGIEPSEGLEIIQRILGVSASQVIVSTVDFNKRIKESGNSLINKLSETEQQEDKIEDFGERKEYPANEMEQIILNLWRDFLGNEQISVHDNFFEIGATSLALIQISLKLKKILKVDIPVVSLYINPTTRELANYLATGNNDDTIINNDNTEESEKINSNKSKLQKRKQRLRK